MFIYLYLVFAFLGLFSFLSKNTRIFDYLILIIIGIIIGLNRDNNDYIGYQNIFNGDDQYGEFGYLILVDIIKYLGFDHRMIVFLVGSVVFLSFYRIARQVKYFGPLLLCYSFFPLVNDIIQIRNTLMAFLLMNSVLDYFENKKIRSLCLYLLSISMHTFAAVFALPLLLLYYVNDNRRRIIVIVIMIFFTMFVIIAGIPYPLDSIGRVSGYISAEVKYINFAFFILVFLDLFVLKCLIAKIDPSHCSHFNKIKFLYLFIFSSIVLLPGLLMINHFYRLIGVLFIFKYITAGFIIGYLKLPYRIFLICWLMVTSIPLGIRDLILLDADLILFSNQLFYFFDWLD